MTWRPTPDMGSRQIEKEVNRQAVLFEEKCMKGYSSSAIRFEEFAEQWFEEYAKPNLRNTTYERLIARSDTKSLFAVRMKLSAPLDFSVRHCAHNKKHQAEARCFSK